MVNLKKKLKLPKFYNSPHSSIVIGIFGLFAAATGIFSIFLTTNNESSSITLPNTTCLPSKRKLNKNEVLYKLLVKLMESNHVIIRKKMCFR